MAFHSHHVLTHDVVDHDVSVLVEGDVELVNGRVGIEVHLRVAAHLFFHGVEAEEFFQVKTEGLIVVVVCLGVTIVDGVGVRLTIHLAGDHEGVACDGSLWVDAFRHFKHEVGSEVLHGGPCQAMVHSGTGEYFEIVKAGAGRMVLIHGNPNGNKQIIVRCLNQHGHFADAAVVFTMSIADSVHFNIPFSGLVWVDERLFGSIQRCEVANVFAPHGVSGIAP